MRPASPGVTMHRTRGSWSTLGNAAALLLVALAVVVADIARADEPPAFRQGLWQFDRTVGGQNLQTKSCTNPGEDMKRQDAILEKGGCKSSQARDPATHTPSPWTAR